MGKRDKRDKRDKRRKYMREITPPLSKIPPTRKLSQGTVFTASLKIVVMNVYRWFRRRDHAVSEAAELTASCTGVSRSSVFQFRKEESSPQGLKDRKMTRVRKKLAANSRDVKYDDKARSAIRTAVFDLKNRNITASLNNILGQYKLHSDLPALTANTLRRLLHDMGFIYKKEGNKHILVEKSVEAEKKAAEKKNREKKPQANRRRKSNQANKCVGVDFEEHSEAGFDPNMFDNQYLPKTEYMFFQSEANKELLQQQQPALDMQDIVQSLQKTAKNKNDAVDLNKEKLPKKLCQSETTVINPNFETNIFDSQHQQQQQQYTLPPKTEYMFYDNKQQSHILHQSHQMHIQPQQQQMQQNPQALVQVQMPPPILPSSIHHRDMQILPTTKLMMLAPAQNNVPWG